eukprot:TRINITY_DN1138_c0_g1_i5.p1 TRINITY_DN1138_c0_g1~~TRINITY_DN1138_c0_g1_i5.p1  ORF type:complete len:656 (+),score=116.95 TRINITY_DN1138_c0_g1_i5:54-2021(+)
MTGNNRRGKSGNSKQKQKQKQKQEQNPNASKSSSASSSTPSSSVYDALSSTLTVNDEGIDGSVEESMENTETRQDLCEESLYEQSKDGDLRTATITSDIATEGLISEQNKDSGVEISSAEIVEQNVEASVSLLKSMDEIHVGGTISKDDSQFSNFDSQNISRDGHLLENDPFLMAQHQNTRHTGDVSVDEDEIRRQTEEYYIRNGNERAGSPKLFQSTIIISPEETNTLSEELTHTMAMPQEDKPSDSIVEGDDNVVDMHLKIHKMMQNNDDSLNLIGGDGSGDDASPKDNMDNILEMGIGGYSPIAKDSSLSQVDELFPGANDSIKDFGNYSPCGPLLQSYSGIPKEKPQHPHSIALLRKAAKVPLCPVPQTTEDETLDMKAQDVQLPPEPHTPVTQKINTASHHAPSSEDVTFPASSKQIIRYHPGRAQTTASHPGTLSWGEIVARFEIDHNLDLTEYKAHVDLIGGIINLYDVAIRTQSVDAVRESIELIDIAFKEKENDIKTQLAKQVNPLNYKMEKLQKQCEGLETSLVQLVDENGQLKAENNILQTRTRLQDKQIEDLRSQVEQWSLMQSIETEKPDIRKTSFPERSSRAHDEQLEAKNEEIRSLTSNPVHSVRSNHPNLTTKINLTRTSVIRHLTQHIMSKACQNPRS